MPGAAGGAASGIDNGPTSAKPSASPGYASFGSGGHATRQRSRSAAMSTRTTLATEWQLSTLRLGASATVV